MRIIQSCADCLYDKQQHLTDDEGYLAEVRNIIDNRDENDTSPYLVYLFNQAYERRFGKRSPYKGIKRKYNDLVLSLEPKLREKIEASSDPLATSLIYSRLGNYIDFGAMNTVDEDTFLGLLEQGEREGVKTRDIPVVDSLISQCATAGRFLLITDNCGEIVLDKLFLEQLKKRFPQLEITVLVRGGEVLNDATIEDAEYVGLTKIARTIGNGNSIGGTVYNMLTDEAKEALDNSDVILAKGQGNYESLCRQGRHIFYSFLCKCDLFTDRFSVPRLTGIIVEERS